MIFICLDHRTRNLRQGNCFKICCRYPDLIQINPEKMARPWLRAHFKVSEKLKLTIRFRPHERNHAWQSELPRQEFNGHPKAADKFIHCIDVSKRRATNWENAGLAVRNHGKGEKVVCWGLLSQGLRHHAPNRHKLERERAGGGSVHHCPRLLRYNDRTKD